MQWRVHIWKHAEGKGICGSRKIQPTVNHAKTWALNYARKKYPDLDFPEFKISNTSYWGQCYLSICGDISVTLISIPI